MVRAGRVVPAWTGVFPRPGLLLALVGLVLAILAIYLTLMILGSDPNLSLSYAAQWCYGE